LLLIVGSANAQVTLSAVEGSWDNEVGGLNVIFPTDVSVSYGNGLEDQVRWGEDVGNGQSGLGFTGIAGPSTFAVGDPFEVGQLQHYNNTVGLGSSCSAVDLTISLSFSDPAGLTGDFTFTLNINETPNTTVPPDDFIYFPSAIPPQTFEMDGRLHRLELLGFGPDADHLTNEFQSPEASTNATLLWARITEVEITIDIKPGSFPNSINLKQKGVTPVAILTTEAFDASTVDPETVRFGPAEASPLRWALEDVDDDGDIDMILHFKTQETGISPGDTEATLTGETLGGVEFVATDSVRTVPPA
jgi:hypothetical protein